jgi:hypothetical protein
LKHLILLASQACLLNHVVTEMEKSEQLKAKLGQALQLGKIKFSNRGTSGFAQGGPDGAWPCTARQC